MFSGIPNSDVISEERRIQQFNSPVIYRPWGQVLYLLGVAWAGSMGRWVSSCSANSSNSS